jgi:hypothetical protein
MHRQLIAILVLFLATLGILYFVEDAVISAERLRPDFPAKSIFIFNAVFSLVLLIALSFFSKKKAVSDNLGFIYLATVIVKPIVFIIVFRALFFDSRPITQLEAISMLLPTLIALFFEALFCSKILKATMPKKNIPKG